MSCSLLSALILSGALTFQDTPKETTGYPKAGSNIPGPFRVYNVTGAKKGRFQCLVSRAGLNPVAIVVVRGTDAKDKERAALKSLMVKLDNAADKNPTTRLTPFAVFLTTTLKDLAREDDQRDRLALNLEDLAKDQGGFKHLVLGLTTPERMAKWKLSDKADVTVVLYKGLRTVAVHELTWAELTGDDASKLPAKIKEIMEQLRDQFGVTR